MSRKLLLALSVAGALAFMPILFAQMPRPCQIAPPGLPESTSDQDVIFRTRPFEHAQIRHTLKTFSEHAPSGQTRAEECFRYEVENAGGQNLQSVYWELAGIFVDPLKPNARRSRVRHVQIVDNPEDINTTVNAFENTPVVTRAWAGRAAVSAARRTATAGPLQPAVLAANDVVPNLGQWMQTNGLPNAPILGFVLGDAGTPASSTDRYSGAGVQLLVRSTVQRSGATIFLDTAITAEGPNARTSSYAMPSLRAMQAPSSVAENLVQYDAFLSRVREVSEFSSWQDGWKFSVRLPVTSLRNGVVYRTRHPIALQLPAGELDCVMVDSYAPLAVNFGLRQCPGVGARR